MSGRNTKHKEIIAEIRRLGAQVCEATARDDFKRSRRLRCRIHYLLRKELHERPDLTPGLLRLKSAWCSRSTDRLRLLKRSYLCAKKLKSEFHMGFSALALADDYVRNSRNHRKAKNWLTIGIKHADGVSDPDLRVEIHRLKSALANQGVKNKAEWVKKRQGISQ